MIFIDKNPKSILAEKYRQLRTSIEYSSIDKNLKTIVITSSEMGEGKSTVVSNLACTLQQNNKKVLIIDCDLRKPTIHKKFSLSNQVGLTNYLLDKSGLDEIIQIHQSRVHILTAGTIPPNPAEIVSSRAMENLIEELREKYDYILIDTPPVRVVTDGVVLSSKADGTILVVRAHYAKDSSIKKGFEELKKVNVNIIGTVLNCVEEDKKNYIYDVYCENKK